MEEPTEEQSLAQQQKLDQERARNEQQRNAILSQLLTAEAMARLDTISLVRPQQAEGVKNTIIRQAQTGQLRGKVTETALVSFLEQIASESKTSIKITRKKSKIDDSSEEDDFNDL